MQYIAAVNARRQRVRSSDSSIQPFDLTNGFHKPTFQSPVDAILRLSLGRKPPTGRCHRSRVTDVDRGASRNGSEDVIGNSVVGYGTSTAATAVYK